MKNYNVIEIIGVLYIERNNEVEAIFEEKMTEKFANLMKNIHL